MQSVAVLGWEWTVVCHKEGRAPKEAIASLGPSSIQNDE